MVKLSPTRQRVYRLLAQGKSNKEIAHALGNSPPVVRNHITAIMRSTGILNRVQLALAWHGIQVEDKA